jgi:phosphopentomutase
MRALILVMDSMGIGAAPDAAAYGDDGADTIGHIADACAVGGADSEMRQGPLHLPHLVELGLGEAHRLATGRQIPDLAYCGEINTQCGCASEQSSGKDTPSGHWEIAGVPVRFVTPRGRTSSRSSASNTFSPESRSVIRRPIACFRSLRMNRASGWRGYMKSVRWRAAG